MADYISREAAIDMCDDDGDIIRIRNIPAADVRPVVHGTWIETAPINEETWTPIIVKGPHLKCSNCGSIEFQRKFCPNCGADMREAKTDEK